MIRHFITHALRQLRRPTIVGALATLGVMIGAANIIALISVTDTARHQTMGLLRDVGARTMFVLPFVEGEQNALVQRANVSAFLPPSYTDALQALPELDRVADLIMMAGRVRAVPLPGEQLPPADKDAAGDDRYRFFATVEGASPQYPDVRGHHPAQGRFPDAADNAARARVCALGSDLPMKLFGRPDVLGREIELRGERFRVVGIMQEKGFVGFESFDKRVFIPLATAREIYGLPGSHDILIRAREDVDLKQAQAAATAALRKAAGLAQGEPADFTITTVEELTGLVNSTLVVFRVMLYGISSVALLVAGIGIMNVMLMQVIERTREIGVRRAVGARRRDILAQFLAEAVAQTLIGVVLGVGLGVAAALGFCWVVHWKPFIRPDTILLATIFSVGVGLLFGVYPAFHAALLKPIDCLRYE